MSDKINTNNFIGLGTAAIGRPQYINIKQGEATAFSIKSFRQEGLQMLDRAYKMGLRYFDTAPGYGMAERLMIDWLGGQKDPNIVVATKWGYTYVADFDPNAKVHELKEHSLAKLNEQWERSKELFPYLKYYQIHSATFDTGVLENKAVLERLFELKEERNIQVGLTTTGSNQVEVLSRALDVHFGGEQLFEVFQTTYNILDQSIYDLGCEILSQNKKLVIKEALANGRLFPNSHYPHYLPLYDKLKTLAIKYEAGIDAILLRFCHEQLNNATILSGANNPEHLAQNLRALDFGINEEDIFELSGFKNSPEKYWDERKLLAWN